MACVLFVIVVFAAAMSAQAQQAPPTAPLVPTRALSQAVELDAGGDCLEHERLVRRIARWLERERIDHRIHIRVEVGAGRESREIAFYVELREPTNEGAQASDEPHAARYIEEAPQDCDQLHSALALSIALAIDATLVDVERDDLPLPEDDDEVFEPASPPYFRLAAGVLAGASSGVLTGVALGLAARVELGFMPWLDLRLGGSVARIEGQRIRDTPGSFDIELMFGRLDVCAVADMIARLRLLGCVSGLLGGFETMGRRYSTTRDERLLWSAGALGLEVQVELASWLAAVVNVELVLPLADRTIEVMVGDMPVGRDLTSAGEVVSAGLVFRVF